MAKKAGKLQAQGGQEGKPSAAFMGHQMPVTDYSADFRWAPPAVSLCVGTMRLAAVPEPAPQQWTAPPPGTGARGAGSGKLEAVAPSNEYVAIETQPKANVAAAGRSSQCSPSQGQRQTMGAETTAAAAAEGTDGELGPESDWSQVRSCLHQSAPVASICTRLCCQSMPATDPDQTARGEAGSSGGR
jgi:hypothetical protein